ncbi:MAG: hypothetical protein AAF641_07640 [Pseudomonadota bacterium]
MVVKLAQEINGSDASERFWLAPAWRSCVLTSKATLFGDAQHIRQAVDGAKRRPSRLTPIISGREFLKFCELLPLFRYLSGRQVWQAKLRTTPPGNKMQPSPV